ncbi:Ku protein [Bacillus sp. SM2101]|uniref:non-homologous end joining protein Ku n=1 Tax=Bacillus sp. SM2101 TaxID=2805366 RepID=UPI001BDEAB6E|nr:Ku protein [Bacillus sp. SM2101]
MHTIWKGSISFGLVTIPIKLYAATEDKDIKFRSLHKKCKTPIKYEKICPICNEELTNDNLVKGYEYVKGKFVILSEEEMKELKEEYEEKSIKIIDFVNLDDIDPIYFNRSYFIGPNDNGTRAYALLREALVKSKRIGIAEITIRSKRHLAIVRVYHDGLLMETIHYPDEVRNVSDVPNIPEQIEINNKELDTAMLLIDQLTTDFDPSKYKDDYRTALMKLIEEKVNTDETTSVDDIPRTNVVDLMSALQASIDRTKEQPQSATPANNKGTTKTKQRTSRKKVTS